MKLNFNYLWKAIHILAFGSLFLACILQGDNFFPFEITAPIEIEAPNIEVLIPIDHGPWECRDDKINND